MCQRARNPSASTRAAMAARTSSTPMVSRGWITVATTTSSARAFAHASAGASTGGSALAPSAQMRSRPGGAGPVPRRRRPVSRRQRDGRGLRPCASRRPGRSRRRGEGIGAVRRHRRASSSSSRAACRRGASCTRPRSARRSPRTRIRPEVRRSFRETSRSIPSCGCRWLAVGGVPAVSPPAPVVIEGPEHSAHHRPRTGFVLAGGGQLLDRCRGREGSPTSRRRETGRRVEVREVTAGEDGLAVGHQRRAAPSLVSSPHRRPPRIVPTRRGSAPMAST